MCSVTDLTVPTVPPPPRYMPGLSRLQRATRNETEPGQQRKIRRDILDYRRPAPKAPWPRLLPHFGLGSSACRPEPRLASHLALRAFAAAIPQQLLDRSTHPCAGEMELKPGMSALVTGGASGIGKRRPSSPGPQRLAKRCSVPSPDAPCRFTSTCTKGSIRTN
jgi:hypothetical protein